MNFSGKVISPPTIKQIYNIIVEKTLSKKKNAVGKQTTRSDIFALSKSSTLNFLGPCFLLDLLQSNSTLLTISWTLLFLNALGYVTQIPFFCSARHIVNKILKTSLGQKPTNNNKTLLEAFRIMAMIMSYLLLLGTSYLKTLF